MAGSKTKADILDTFLEGEFVDTGCRPLYSHFPTMEQAFISQSRKMLKVGGVAVFFNDDWTCTMLKNKYELVSEKNNFFIRKTSLKPEKKEVKRRRLNRK